MKGKNKFLKISAQNTFLSPMEILKFLFLELLIGL